MDDKKESKKTTKKRVARKRPQKNDPVKFWRTTAFVLLGLIVITQFLDISIRPRFKLPGFSTQTKSSPTQNNSLAVDVDISRLQSAVLPAEGVKLPIKWGDLGRRMIADGVIDETKFRALFKNGLQNTEEQMFTGVWDNDVILTPQNSRFIIDMLWAFGLANKNEILQEEMLDEKYGGDASRFASTGGWTLAKGTTMDHYGKHPYVVLAKEQQDLLDKVSKNIYRPCCGNTAHFPDCNHGMAMLGLLQLMAANNVGEEEMYNVALKANSSWFPQTYLDLATYFEEQGQSWDQVDPKLVLGPEYSSAQGYQSTRQKINSLPKPSKGGGGCGA